MAQNCKTYGCCKTQFLIKTDDIFYKNYYLITIFIDI